MAAFWAECVWESERLTFGAPADGTYTLWFDIPPYAPLVVRGVTFDGADVDLGAQRCEMGSRLHVKALVREGGVAPRLSVWVKSLEPPIYTRGLNSEGETEVFLGGLGPGRHRVMVLPVMEAGSGKRVQLEIEVDGDPSTVEQIELDLR
jgi:hypothetical protein